MVGDQDKIETRQKQYIKEQNRNCKNGSISSNKNLLMKEPEILASEVKAALRTLNLESMNHIIISG